MLFGQAVTAATTLTSPLNQNVSITYKSPDAGTCNTVFATQKQYTGYVSLPPFTLAPVQQNYSINTFFWFVEAREKPDRAPLTVWLNGGPGSSSMFGFFEEVGPCEVVAQADGSYGTQARMWGWDRTSNMLFIDQPAQVGLSYDTLRNGSKDLLTDQVVYPPTDVPAGQPAYTFLNGTFGSGSSTNTANTTEIAAGATWHFLQAWLSSFPQYNPGRSSASSEQRAAGVHLFAESYGGKYGPTFANYFDDQTDRITRGEVSGNNTVEIRIETLGIVNGVVDDLIQNYYQIQYAYNNSYGYSAISQLQQLNSLRTYQEDCVPAIGDCRRVAALSDPQNEGDEFAVNSVCSRAQYACYNASASAFLESGRNVYDIRITDPSPEPSAAYQEYLNNATVQQSIGARINYTESNVRVQNAFIATGDTIRSDPLADLVLLLQKGVRVAFLYGDADWICNWRGGEAISLALASLLNTTTSSPNPSASPFSVPTPPFPSATGSPGTYASAFPAAGYADIVVNSTYVGGAVRQYGNLSFSRIYDAAHFAPYSQPETAFTIFSRVILGTDISTGNTVDLTTYASRGPSLANRTNDLPQRQPSPTCWLRTLDASCTDDDVEAIKDGTGVVRGGVWYARERDVQVPTADQGTTASSTVVATGVFTATSTPTPTGAGPVARAHLGPLVIVMAAAAAAAAAEVLL
ncbi:Carboxypeptidase Y [Sphaceloma murrayae]|uniref:Carboxypeptidase n=1 Tax=Sphaceloma murrayae TaxID=2082308 RepID=A0A2K1R0T2_9PEZI|nr:Carboxypeptidase Y [Sphaceloma murrayae]